MQRKIIKQGKNGFTIYLPKRWIDKKGLSHGDEIDIIENENTLQIGSPVVQKKKIALEINEENRSDIRHLLTHMYRKGFDKIILKKTNDEDVKHIRKLCKNLLLGFELTDRTEKSCILENLSEPTDIKYENLLRRIFLVIKETQNSVKRDFINDSMVSMQEIADLRDQQDRLILFCKRIFTKQRYQGNIIIHWELLTFLMHIQHCLYYLYKYAYDNKLKNNKKIKEMIDYAEKYFEYFYKAYYKKDLKYIHKQWNLKHKVQYSLCFDNMNNITGKYSTLYSYFRELYRLLQLGLSPILTLLLEDEY